MASIAVEVHNGYKYYGSASNPSKKVVLNYLNMTVMSGSIYGLLGASGCGKTTLLSCIVGQRELNSGEIKILGLKPGCPGTGIPGPRIGYMPQEIALVAEMTVTEIIFYFGRIYGLNDQKIRERYKLLKTLLELPPSGQLVVKCSGGQQRRISFACAMVHEPEILILDEPTVGLDPVLREKIWDFLVQTTKSSKMAVIITTHYIEEAKQADCIGLMRNGILLAEGTPDNIMGKFECNSLEDAFLILSQRQGKSEEADTTIHHKDNTNISSVDIITNNNEKNGIIDKAKPLLRRNLSNYDKSPPITKRILQFTSRRRIKALLTKNILQLIRQPSGIIFMFIFPILQLSCFYLAIGNDPKGLKIGVVNYEVDNPEICFNDSLITIFTRNDTCDFYKISCRYIQNISPVIADKIYYKTEDEAYNAAKHANVIGYIQFAHNFSKSLQMLLDEGRFIDDGSQLTSQLNVKLDMSDFQLAYFIQRKLRTIYMDFIQDIMVDCNLPKQLANVAIKFEDPIYGTFNDEFQRYIAPGVVMTMVFFVSTLMTSAVFITERIDGVWDRTLIAGISKLEMLISHIIIQTIVMSIQCIEVVIFIACIFTPQNNGDNITLMFLLILTGFTGIQFGLLISVFCKSHTLANFVSTGFFYPMIILCGLLWPLEGMPTLLKNVALIFPFTIPSISARNILEKGWSITNIQVYSGFLVMFTWVIIFLLFIIMGLKRKT